MTAAHRHDGWDLIAPTTCELLDDSGVARVTARLGPDLLRPDADEQEAVRRLLAAGGAVAVAVVNQAVQAKIAAEECLDGKYLLSTSDPDLSAEDVALGYKNPLEAERGLRDLTSTLDLRPVFHRVEPRIRAHVLLCWLALLLIRVAERRAGLTWRRIEVGSAGCTPSP